MASPTSSQQPRRLAELRVDEIADYLTTRDTAIIPVGATEQHGRHLPLGVDAMTAIAVAEDAAAQTGVIVTPPVWFGWSPHHMGFAGTVTLRPETLTHLIEDLGSSLLHHGFRRIIVVNGHRLANLPPLAIAATRLRADTGAAVVVADLAHLAQPEYAHWAQTEGTFIGHADGYETGHMLHLHPELVDAGAVPEDAAPAHPQSLRTIDPSIASTRAAWWPSTEAELVASGDGSSGRPSWGDAGRGETLHRAMVRDLVELIGQVEGFAVEVRRPEAPR